MYEFRKMKISDIEEVVKLEASLFSNPWTTAQYHYELEENPISFSYVAIHEGKIIGFIVFWITFNSSTLCKIGVHQDFQQQSIGTSLLSLMEIDLNENEVETSTLEVRVNNTKAINFYQKQGYQKVTIKEGYYEDGMDAIYMMKVLI